MQNDRNRWEQYRGGVHPFSIMLTNYLAGYLRRKAILLEFNESGDLEKLEYVCTGQMGQKNPYRVPGCGLL